MDLVEKVASAIDPFLFSEHGMGENESAFYRAERHAIRKRAHAALRIALEEAAKVAEDVAQSSDAKFDGIVDKARGGSKNLELAGATAIGMSHTARNIATAIRSLLPEEPTR
jgi:hypothetical protein